MLITNFYLNYETDVCDRNTILEKRKIIYDIKPAKNILKGLESFLAVRDD
jgi:hypothetical protein